MIITKQKDITQILKSLENKARVFIVGCGECSTTCKTGGEDEIQKMISVLKGAGKTVTGYCVPSAPCIAAKVKIEFVKHRKAIDDAEVFLILSCGLGAQSVKDNIRIHKDIVVGCDTLFMGQIDSGNIFHERCKACGDCVLEMTEAICPVTRCPKSLMNGPCGGQDKGKCEVDREKDCAWILIYNELKKYNKLYLLSKVNSPKDHSKALSPRKVDIN